ncbi:hypothetical protein MMC30_004752 [Trapelia coarctata]|nr:hypothetical protein [Trapelia coarctata]
MAMPSSESQYFTPGFGISRHINFAHMRFYLRPQATVRPYSYRGREGYLTTAPGPPLTRLQIEDLQNLSRLYELEVARHVEHLHLLDSGGGRRNYGTIVKMLVLKVEHPRSWTFAVMFFTGLMVIVAGMAQSKWMLIVYVIQPGVLVN